jgi:RNA polymerase sigma-70 factor (ECF subfamily)
MAQIIQDFLGTEGALPTRVRSDEDLMAAYIQDDQAAFRELFARLAPVIGTFIERRVGNAADVEEVAQQTFLQLHRARHDFRLGCRVRPWVMTIAANLIRDLLRRRGRRFEATIDVEAVAEPTTTPDATVDGLSVRAAVATLPARPRAAIELHWFEGLTYDQIATRVRSSAGAVRVSAHRAMLALRQVMS